MAKSKKKSVTKQTKKKPSLSAQEVIEIVDEQPEEVQEKVEKRLVARQVQGHMYSGPIPPPALLKEFNDVIPNGADRIMIMAEQQSSHRIEAEKEIIKANNRDSLLGVIFGGLIGILAVIGSIWLISNNKNIQGFAILIGSLGTLISIFFRSEKRDFKDLEQEESKDRESHD